jgi:hypothetical protein
LIYQPKSSQTEGVHAAFPMIGDLASEARKSRETIGARKAREARNSCLENHSCFFF